jgi:phage FluMu protein Com
MTRLDGNAIAGPLADLFAIDLTMASARCAGCGSVELLATAIVYADAMGDVVRCPHCDQVLATLVRNGSRAWFSMRGISALELAP